MDATFAMAINVAISTKMSQDPSVIIVGEGVPDGIFGSTKGLAEQFPNRVFDSPLSENGVTGFCIGAALNGMKPIMVHQRMDFSLLSFDQLINNAAKWKQMFGGKKSVPMVVRMIVGRGWGQGPQHSQTFHSMLASVPGLRVYMPHDPQDAYSMTYEAISNNEPTIIIEHRWLYEIKDQVNPTEIPISSVNWNRFVCSSNVSNITVVSMSYGTTEVKKAINFLKSEYGNNRVNVDLINLGCVNPLHVDDIIHSVKNTGCLLVVDIGHDSCSVGSEVIRRVMEKGFSNILRPPKLLANKPYPQPTSHFITDDYYVNYKDIATAITDLLGFERPTFPISYEEHDKPNYEGVF